VYARSTTIQAQAGSIDDGIANVRDEVLPALTQLDGFVGLSLMVDRGSGRCITTTSWADEDAMRESRGLVGPIRDRVAEILGGTPEVEEWEIAVMRRGHLSHDGACVRTGWLQTDTNRADALIDVYKTDALPQIEGLDGFCSASFMVNRDTGRAVSSVCFDSREAMEATRDASNQIRTAGVSKAGASILEVAEFDLEVAHLRVPEMA
jgi:heme-degrading monooxygenase HmoA